MLTVSDDRVRTPVVALIGNPNSGKSSLFNALTGARQKIGNYPGVTVEKVAGDYDFDGTRVSCVDVPGLYSLNAVSLDESVAAAVIADTSEEDAPDLFIVVLDASNLERNLFFYSQVVEEDVPCVVALTMTDVLSRDGKVASIAELERLLDTRVVATIAHKGEGIEELKKAVADALKTSRPVHIDVGFPEAVNRAVDAVRAEAANKGVATDDRTIRRALLGDEGRVPKDLHELSAPHRKQLLGSSAQGKTIDTQARYAWAAMVTKASISAVRSARRSNTERIDWFLTHRLFGLVFFVGLMYVLFQSIYSFAGPLMSGIEWGIEQAKGAIAPMLETMPVLKSLMIDGIVTGIGAVLVFLPQICILFFLIALLEGTGYLARAAFLMDRLLGWCGLNGRAFIPLLSSFACAVPGIMAARVMPDAKSRLVTVMVAPLMSCSARLPVYILLIGAFIQPKYGAAWAGFSLFLMHFVGLFVAIPVVLVLNKGVLKGKRLPFTLELPRYQSPRWKDVGLTVYSRARMFLQTAGTIIFAMSILIWALLYFPRSEEAEAAYRKEYATAASRRVTEDNYVAQRQLRDSYLGRFGRAIEPAFVPAGFDWRLTTGILAAFPAREVVIPALGIIFSLGGDVDEESGDLRTALQEAQWPDGRRLMTPWNAVSMMVFFALCCQCMATLATIRRETNSWKWPVAAFVYMTALAYLAAVFITWLGRVLT